MSGLKCGQIWLVNFDPSFGYEYKKMRPALIVQNDKFIVAESLITLVPLSSQVNKKFDLDILITKAEQNRLLMDSLIKVKQISTFDQRRLVKLIGVADNVTLRKVKKNLSAFVG